MCEVSTINSVKVLNICYFVWSFMSRFIRYTLVAFVIEEFIFTCYSAATSTVQFDWNILRNIPPIELEILLVRSISSENSATRPHFWVCECWIRFLSSSIYVDCIQTRSNFYDEGETEEGRQWEKIFSVFFSSKRCLHKASQPIIPFWWPFYLENKIDRWKWGWNVESKTWQPQNANMNCFWKS